MIEDDTIKLLRQCDAGFKMSTTSLSRYLNQYKAADETSKDIAKRLISLEDGLTLELRLPFITTETGGHADA